MNAQIDISNLSVDELDALIAAAAERRATIQSRVNDTRPGKVQALLGSPWFVTPAPEGALFQINHAGYGWLAFMLSPTDRVLLLSLLLQQSLLSPPVAPSTITPAPATAGGSGVLH